MIRGFIIFFFCSLILACDTASTIKQPGKNYFLKYYGGEGNQLARDLIVNADGTFYILGNSTQTTSSNTKVYIAKVDALGNVIKQITYGQYSMDARDFELTSDGKLAVVANRQSPSNDILLSRFSLDLNLIDSAVVSQLYSVSNAYANSLTELSDGGFIIEGYQNTGTQLIELHLRVDKTLANYNSISTSGWTYYSSQGTIDVGVKTIEHDPSTFYMFGYFNANFFGQLGTTSNRFWTYPIPYNGSASTNSDAPSYLSAGGNADKILTNALKAAAGGYLMIGISNPTANYGLKVAITYSTDVAFNFQSTGVFRDTILLSNMNPHPNPALNPYATAFSATTHNFILANTYYNTPSGNSDIILLKVGNDLSSMWTNLDGSLRYVQFGGSGEDTAAAVAELPDGHIMVLGTMNLGNPPQQFKIALMKLNADGQLQD